MRIFCLVVNWFLKKNSGIFGGDLGGILTTEVTEEEKQRITRIDTNNYSIFR